MPEADPAMGANGVPENRAAMPHAAEMTALDGMPAGHGSGDANPSRGLGEGPREMWMDTGAQSRELERMHHGVPIQCQFCVGQKFRRSRLRGGDIRQLLLMRYPVRCTRCSQRQAVSFTVAGISIPSYVRSRDRGKPSSGYARSQLTRSETRPETRSETRPDTTPRDPAPRA